MQNKKVQSVPGLLATIADSLHNTNLNPVLAIMILIIEGTQIQNYLPVLSVSSSSKTTDMLIEAGISIK